MPERIEPGDRLLAQIASLHEVDGAGVAADLLREVFLGDVLAENGRARLDPQNLEGLGTSFEQTEVAARSESSPSLIDADAWTSPINVRPGSPAGDSRMKRTGWPAISVIKCASSTPSGIAPPQRSAISKAAGPAR